MNRNVLHPKWLLALLLLVLPASAWAEDEEDGAPMDDGDLPDDEDESEEEGKAGEEQPGEGSPDITRTEEDDVDSWSFEGEVQEKKEEKKEVKKKKLAPEPKRYGISGNWYEVQVDCADCESLLGQKLGIEEPLVMREYFDYVQISSDRSSGKFVLPSEGETRPVGVKDGGSRVLIWSYVTGSGTRLTDTFATLWDLYRKASDGLLYGRKYQVQVWTSQAYQEYDGGYRASSKYIPTSRLTSYADLAPVKGLTAESNRFQVGESARVNFIGFSAFARSDVSEEAIAADQEKLRAQAQAQAQQLRDQGEFFEQGEQALDDRDWEAGRDAFLKARSLGMDSLDLNFYLGFTYQKTKDFENAIKEYRTILGADPRDTDVRYNLARIYEKQKDWDNAIKEYQAILKFNPDDQGARDRLELLRAAREMVDG